METHESREDYLESILILSEGGTKDVHSVELARRLGVSKPTVTKGVKLLVRDGYVYMDGVHLCLTGKGLEAARSVYGKHTVITAFWESFGVPSEIAQRDACRMEHIVSDEVFAVMKAHVGMRDGPKEEGDG